MTIGDKSIVLSTVRRTVIFTIRQLITTFKQPSRLFAVGLALIPPLALFVLRVLPDRWIKTTSGKEFCVKTGYQLFQRDRPEEAWRWYEAASRAAHLTRDEDLLAALCLYHGLGRFRDAMTLFARANERAYVEATGLGLGGSPYRVLDGFWARHIGDTAELDYIVKLGILEGRAKDDTVMYMPPGSPVANRFLFQQLAAHFRLVEDSARLPFDVSALQALHFGALAPRMPDGATVYFWEIAARTYRRWREEGRGPLLTLPDDIKARGWNALQTAGLAKDAWFVALHVREGKWYGANTGPRGILNADIRTYLPAIAEIARRGGWVIRMGDPGMSPLPHLPNVIDYCHSPLRADWMDIFIAAQCRFLLGTSSGPAYIPPLYRVPSVLTNWWPPAQRPWYASDIFVPKVLRRLTDGRYLTLSEMLCEPFSYCHSYRYLLNHERVTVENNDAELIQAAVEEMLSRPSGSADENSEASDLQLRAHTIYENHGAYGMARLTRAFLLRYRDLIA